MKNKKSLFFCILLAPALSMAVVGSSNSFSASKKPSLSGLKQKIEQEQVQKQAPNDSKNVKKGRKNPSLLTRAIQYIENKKQFFVKKARLFYRRHFYISVMSLGLLSALTLYCLRTYGVPFFYDLINKYKQNRGVITQGFQASETTQKNINPVKETITQPKTSKPLLHQEVVQEPAQHDISDQKSEFIEKVVTQDTIQDLNQKVETQTTALPSVQTALPFAKIRSEQEIKESTNLYKKTKTFINETLAARIEHFNELKNECEVAKKRAQASPYNIQLYNDYIKKEQAVIKHKDKLVQATKEVAQKIDSSDFLNKYGTIRELTEDDLGKPRKAVIANKRSVAFADAAVYEHYYGNLVNEHPEENFKKALQAQQNQHQEFNYMRGILKKVLLPFIESL
jgi:hypothetical protein